MHVLKSFNKASPFIFFSFNIYTVFIFYPTNANINNRSDDDDTKRVH